MSSALIGYTGFVGSNLLRQRHFDELYNSKNIEDIAGRQLDLVVCAGVPAEKWRANQNPTVDWHCLQRLLGALLQADIERLILLSTVDVYGKPLGVTEDDVPTDATPYGTHRERLERLLGEQFQTLVVRLPGLFGTGLKKNAIYDLLHDNQVERIDSRNTYQFYGLDTLWQDIEVTEQAGLSLVHFATEPVAMHEVAESAFGRAFHNEVVSTPARYDMRSRHAALYDGVDGYIQTRQEVLDALRVFVTREKQLETKCA